MLGRTRVGSKWPTREEVRDTGRGGCVSKSEWLRDEGKAVVSGVIQQIADGVSNQHALAAMVQLRLNMPRGTVLTNGGRVLCGPPYTLACVVAAHVERRRPTRRFPLKLGAVPRVSPVPMTSHCSFAALMAQGGPYRPRVK